MGRRVKPAKVKTEAKRPLARKAPKKEAARVHELEKRLAESLEREKATSEILRVISSSPADAQPVFDAIASRAVQLCDALFSTVYRYDGMLIHHAADNYSTSEMRAILTRGYPSPVDQNNATAAAIRERRIIHIEDVLDDTTPAASREVAVALGYRTALCVPMLRDGAPIGSIAVARRERRPFSDTQIDLIKTFAEQAVIAIENVRLFNELGARNGELTEALEQQTATAEILRVISGSPIDVQPVFDTIARSAVRLCDGYHCSLFRFDGELQHFVAHYGVEPETVEALRRRYPRPPHRDTATGRAILDGEVIHVPDIREDLRFPESQRITARAGYRAVLAVPMFRDRQPIGAVFIVRREARPFSDKQIELVKTFADQAVIAIENVRLFKELEAKNRALTEAHAQVMEILEQQTATAEILRVISSSPTDLQPMLDAVGENAARLCDASNALILRVDGDVVRLVAQYGALAGPPPEEMATGQPINRDWVTGRCVVERRTIHVHDLAAEGDEYPYGRVHQQRIGHRTTLATPLLREGVALGAILIRRMEVRPFSGRQIALLETFADQAVIAIENVRLFKELEARNRDLAEALEQQTATSEVLRAIAHTQTDAQPVFDTIVRSAARLCDAPVAAVFLTDGRMLYHLANHGSSPETLKAQLARFPRPVAMDTTSGVAILTRTIVHVPDIEEPSTHDFVQQSGRLLGFRSVVAVPMLREGEPVGTLNVTRREAGRFSDTEVDLLKTFADQAVIAIENVRLFNELQLANRGLEAASRHKSEFLANMSHELRTPLNAVIGFSEVLTERMFGALNEKQEEYLKDINASGQHLLSLINDILDLSKIEAGRMELELADFHLPQAIEDALVLVRERALRRGITLEQSIDSRLGEIQGDERKVKQVLLNLLSNAIKFTPEGGKIEIRAVLDDTVVQASVSDTGVGIAPEDQEAVFEEFRQVGMAAKKVEGTGLGLALSRRFIELHGGRVWVESQIGVGSTFTFTLPVRRGE